MENKSSKMRNGLKIRIDWLPSCRNVPRGTPNPYIGMSGEVIDFDGEKFDLFTGTSYLVGVSVSSCKYSILS